MRFPSFINHIEARLKLVLLLLVIIVPLLGLQIYTICRDYELNMEQELIKNTELAKSARTAFLNYIESIWDMEYAVGLAIHDHAIAPTLIDDYLNHQLPNIPASFSAYWFNPQGVCLESTIPGAKGLTATDRFWYKRIVKGYDQVLSDLVIGKGSQTAVVPVARAIRKDGALRGIVVVTIDPDKLFTVLPKPHGNRNALGVIDSNARVVYHSLKPSLTWKDRTMNLDSPARVALKGTDVVIPKVKSSIDGSWRMGATLAIKEVGWVVFSTNSIDAVANVYKKNAAKDMATVIVISLIAFVVANGISSGMTKRLQALSDAAAMVGAGDLSAKIAVDGSDEIAKTGHAMNKMMCDIVTLSKTKDEFLSICSHEMKTPLTVILGQLQLMSKGIYHLDSSTLSNLLTKVLSQTWKLDRLINDILDVSRLETNTLKMSMKVTSVSDLVTSVVENFRQGCRTHNVILGSVADCLALMDAGRIEQALTNFLSNAVRYSHPNTTITVGMSVSENGMRIEVSDEGQGIASDDIPHLFDRYYRTKEGSLAVKEGLGLGLYLTAQIVKLHEGKVHVQSEVGRGSTFVIELPMHTVVA